MSTFGVKGHTKIELFEAGKKVKEYDHDNTLTGALAEIFKGVGQYNDGFALLENGWDLTRLFGGVLCFDKALDDSECEAPVDARIIASGVYGVLNGGNNQIRGSYNATESELDWSGHSLKFVYDFATNQGNGDIAAVCLTPYYGGYMNEALARTATDVAVFPLDFNMRQVPKNYGGALSSDSVLTHGYIGKNVGGYSCTGLASRPWDGYGQGTLRRILEIDATTNSILAAEITLQSDASVWLKLMRYPASISSTNVWKMHGDNAMVSEDVEIELGSALYNHLYTLQMSWDYDARRLYVTSFMADYCVWWDSDDYQNYMNPGSAIRVWEVDVDAYADPEVNVEEVEGVTVYNLTNSTGEKIALRRASGYNPPTFSGYVYNGRVYLIQFANSRDAVNRYLYSINLQATADVKRYGPITFSARFGGNSICDAHNGKIMFHLGNNVTRILNLDRDTIDEVDELTAYDYNNNTVIPIRGLSALATVNGHAVGIRPQTLMTVNNIVPVTKTSAQTMKITYTITEG